MSWILKPLNKTLLIIDHAKKIEIDELGQYYVNDRGEKCHISKSAAAMFLRRNSNNPVELQAEIAELKAQIRFLYTKKNK